MSNLLSTAEQTHLPRMFASMSYTEVLQWHSLSLGPNLRIAKRLRHKPSLFRISLSIEFTGEVHRLGPGPIPMSSGIDSNHITRFIFVSRVSNMIANGFCELAKRWAVQ